MSQGLCLIRYHAAVTRTLRQLYFLQCPFLKPNGERSVHHPGLSPSELSFSLLRRLLLRAWQCLAGAVGKGCQSSKLFFNPFLSAVGFVHLIPEGVLILSCGVDHIQERDGFVDHLYSNLLLCKVPPSLHLSLLNF